jgi:hypothetical protein
MQRNIQDRYSITSSARASSLEECQPDRFCGLEIDDELKLGWLIERDIAVVCAVENLANVTRSLAKNFHKINSIGHKPTRLN